MRSFFWTRIARITRIIYLETRKSMLMRDALGSWTRSTRNTRIRGLILCYLCYLCYLCSFLMTTDCDSYSLMRRFYWTRIARIKRTLSNGELRILNFESVMHRNQLWIENFEFWGCGRPDIRRQLLILNSKFIIRVKFVFVFSHHEIMAWKSIIGYLAK